MKKIIIATVLSGLILAGCQKNTEQDLLQPQIELSTDLNNGGFQTIALSAAGENTKGINYFSGTVSSDIISASVVSDGVVLAFGKTENNISTFPVMQNNIEWTYDISAGELSVSGTSRETLASATVAFFAVSPEKLAELETSGLSRNDILNFSYEMAMNLLHK